MSSVETKSQSKENCDSKEGEELSISNAFSSNLLDFIDMCISIIERIEKQGYELVCGSKILSFAHTFVEMQNSDRVIRSFINRSNKDWNTCVDRDEDKLLPNIKALFSGIPDQYVDSILEAFALKDSKDNFLITGEDRSNIWDYIIEFVKLAILYIHEQRYWGILPEGRQGYSKVYQKDISVKKYAKMFKVDLDYSCDEQIDPITAGVAATTL